MTWCVAGLGVLAAAGGAEAQTCAQWAETVARVVNEIGELRAELRDVQVEYRELDKSVPGPTEKWITDQVRRLAAVLADARAAAEAAGCGSAKAITSTIMGGAALLTPAGVAIAGSAGGVSPVMALTLAGDRATLPVASLNALTTGSAPVTVILAGVIRVACVARATFAASGSGLGAYDVATGHMDVPMTVTTTEAIQPASADLLEALVCPMATPASGSIATMLTTRGGLGRPLNKRTGDLALSGPLVYRGTPLTLLVSGLLSPVFP